MKNTIEKIGIGSLWVTFILSLILLIGKIDVALMGRELSDYYLEIALASGISLLVTYILTYISKSGYWPIRIVTKRQAEILDKVDEWDEWRGVGMYDDKDLKEEIDILINKSAHEDEENSYQ